MEWSGCGVCCQSRFNGFSDAVKDVINAVVLLVSSCQSTKTKVPNVDVLSNQLGCQKMKNNLRIQAINTKFSNLKMSIIPKMVGTFGL